MLSNLYDWRLSYTIITQVEAMESLSCGCGVDTSPLSVCWGLTSLESNIFRHILRISSYYLTVWTVCRPLSPIFMIYFPLIGNDVNLRGDQSLNSPFQHHWQENWRWETDAEIDSSRVNLAFPYDRWFMGTMLLTNGQVWRQMDWNCSPLFSLYTCHGDGGVVPGPGKPPVLV